MSENVTIFDSISEHYADLEPKHWPCDKNVLVKCEEICHNLTVEKKYFRILHLKTFWVQKFAS